MVAFKGTTSSIRQYMLKKPNKWGFKLWALCSSSGILYNFHVYQGKEEGAFTDAHLGITASVVYDLCKVLPLNDHFFVYADNYFTSVTLIQKLKERGVYYLGTVRNNRVPKTTLKSEKEIAKGGRGACDFRTSSELGLSMIRWFDNRAVTLLTSYAGIEPLSQVDRFDRKTRQRIKVSTSFRDRIS